MSALRRGMRNTFRNAIRTVGVIAILAVAIGLSVAMLISREAVNKKIDAVRSTTGTAINVTPAGSFGFFGGGQTLSETTVNGLDSIPGVKSVTSTLSPRPDLVSSNLTTPVPSQGGGEGGGRGGFGGFFSRLRIVGTDSPGTALVGGANNGGTESLVSGSVYPAGSSTPEAIVGQDLATTNSLRVGSTFTVNSTVVKVVGIYSAGSRFANDEVLMPLAALQKITDNVGQISNVVVTADTVGDVASVQAAITAKLGSSVDVTSVAQIAEQQLSPLSSVRSIATYTLVGMVVGAGVILLLTMIMIVRERRREIGVLKAIGASNRSVVAQFIAESTTFTLIASGVGLLIGVVLASPITSALVNASSNSGTGAGPGGFFRQGGGGGGGGGLRFGGLRSAFGQVHAAAGWSALVLALGVALLVAIIGSTVAALATTRIRPAEVLRSE